MQKKTFSANPILTTGEAEVITKSFAPQTWIKESTAILIVHGIGNQNPLETLDQLGRGIIETYWNELGYARTDFTITHKVAIKSNAAGHKWFDNFLRISKNGETAYIDLYEYYWANLTQGKVSMRDIQSWIADVVHQAKKFYEENVTMQENSADTNFTKKSNEKDTLSNESKVKFKGFRYKAFLMVVSLVIPFINWLLGLPRWLAKSTIFVSLGVGVIAEKFAARIEDTLSTKMANVIGDIVVYNTADEKCSLYEIRKNILAGAVEAVRYLIEPQATAERAYGRVLLAGHSLGTQIVYDAINRINHLINFEDIKGVRADGLLLDKEGNPDASNRYISDLISGLVTFGSPLDKIAFFLREHVVRENILMLQIINDFHSFRQRDWFNIDELQQQIPVQQSIVRLFEKIPWHNYFDKRDYVSGPLDFYDNVININCDFATKSLKKKENGKEITLTSRFFSFTHLWYWSDPAMFKDIIGNFLR